MARYVAPIDRYFEQAGAGALPNVVMIDPSFTGELRADAHPRGDVGVAAGFVAVVLEALMRSPQWQRSLFVITHDEWGGFFDTLPPITLPDDRASRVDDKNFGQAGFRVPAAHISRYTPGNAVDHTVYDHTSILRFIEWRFLGAPVAGPGPGSTGRWWLTTRDRHAHPVGQLLRTTPVHDDVPSPLIPPDEIPHRVRECVEDVGAGRRPFDVTPEFADLLALLHRPAQNRPWEELVRRS
jgi:Phosphoesterase family